MDRHDFGLKATDKLLQEAVWVLEQMNEQLAIIRRIVNRPPTTLTLSGDFMAFAPGQSARVQLQLGPAGFTVPTSVTYTLTSSDPLVTVTADSTDSTGSTFILSVDATEAVGTSVTFNGNANGTNADGSTLNLSDVTTKVVQAAAPPVNNNPTTLTLVDLPDAPVSNAKKL